jgi:hypothetical protein
MLSKSPRRAASATKLAVVSKEALRKGEELFERPVRLKGLYPPSDVYSRKAYLGSAGRLQAEELWRTYHVIGNDSQVTVVDTDTVD